MAIRFEHKVCETHNRTLTVDETAGCYLCVLDAEQEASEAEWEAYASGADHICVIQETPDGMGCATCLYC